MKKILALACMIIPLTGCESFTATRYIASDKNQYYIKETKTNNKFSVGDVTLSSKEALNSTCRLAGPIQVPGGSYEDYFKNALSSELLNSNIYQDTSSKKVSVVLDKVFVTTTSPASWDISGTFYLNDTTIKTIESSYGYKTSFSALSACNNAADNLSFAVEDFYSQFITSPEFKSLLK